MVNEPVDAFDPVCGRDRKNPILFNGADADNQEELELDVSFTREIP
jgi:hypothetical protein